MAMSKEIQKKYKHLTEETYKKCVERTAELQKQLYLEVTKIYDEEMDKLDELHHCLDFAIDYIQEEIIENKRPNQMNVVDFILSLPEDMYKNHPKPRINNTD